jgi:hypothetical protein
MKHLKIFGLALVALIAFGAMSISSASAASFLSSAKAKLLSANVATQIFKTDQGTVECSKALIDEGESSGTETTSQLALILYQGCIAFGIAEVDISPAHYIFLSSGEVHIAKLISIKVLGLFGGCEISVPAQLVNSVDYKTNGNNLLLEPLVKNIHYTANSSCSPSGSFTDGTYSGRSEAMIQGGSLSFMP